MNNIIPHKWEVKKFDEIFDVVTDYVANGSFASLRENVSYKDDEDYAILVRLQDYSNKFQKNFVYVDEHAYNFLSKSKLNPNDLVICNVGAAGIIFKVPDLKKPMTLGPNSILVRTNESSDYMYYYIQSSIGQQKLKDITTTTAQPKFNKTDFKSIKCILPPLKEQQKIADILSSVDAAIEKTEQVIAKTEEVKKGLMQQLLTKGIGHTEFKQTEIGEIPIDWTVKKLVDITLPKQGIKRGPFGGALKKEIFVEQGYAVYEQQHVINNNMEDFRYFINEDKYLELKSFEVLPNDLLISCSGTVGKVVLVPKNNIIGVINQALLRLRFNDSINPVYALILFTSDFLQKQLIEMSHGSTLKNIVGVPLLKEITIPIPTLKEQQEIISVFTHIEQKLDNEKNKHDLLVKTKQGLMQQLLTGQVRVKID